MPKEAVIVTRMRERIVERKAQLPDLDAAITSHQEALAELMMQRTAIVMGIDADEAMLRDAAPKRERVRKAQAGRKPQTVGDQIGQSGKGA